MWHCLCMQCNHHYHPHIHNLYAMSRKVLLKSISKPHQYILNYYRYNTRGFVEELPQLPENRWNHACAALPSTGVRPIQSIFCRRLLLLEDGADTADFHLFTLFSLAHPGHPSPPFQEHCMMFELQLWEARSGWPGVWMNNVPSDLRWWLNVHSIWPIIKKMIKFFCWPGAWVSSKRLAQSRRPTKGKSSTCCRLYWVSRTALLGVRWTFQGNNENGNSK